VADRVVIDDRFTAERLSRILESPGRVLIVMDCEGAERELLDPESCRASRDAISLSRPTAWTSLPSLKRFRASHRVKRIAQGARDPNEVPELRRLDESDRWLLVDEGRPESMMWLRVGGLGSSRAGEVSSGIGIACGIGRFSRKAPVIRGLGLPGSPPRVVSLENRGCPKTALALGDSCPRPLWSVICPGRPVLATKSPIHGHCSYSSTLRDSRRRTPAWDAGRFAVVGLPPTCRRGLATALRCISDAVVPHRQQRLGSSETKRLLPLFR